MRKSIHILVISLISICTVKAQEITLWGSGTVSFVSSKNVYVKFSSTAGIQVGDTLYLEISGIKTAALTVENKSSTSTVCLPLISDIFKVGDILYNRQKPLEQPTQVAEQREEKTVVETVAPVLLPEDDTLVLKPRQTEKINARISVASYSNYGHTTDLHRMRYALTLNAGHINGSKLSLENYVTYRHTLGASSPGRPSSLAESLKIYNFYVKYDFDSTMTISAGRRINQRMSNLGAVDGIQFEKQIGPYFAGLIAGSRPDVSDYSLNLNLLQGGVYAGIKSGSVSYTTIGLMEQLNQFKEDRRFLYIQHSSQISKKLNLFGSTELDLFENLQAEKRNTFRLTNLFSSLRYKFSAKLQVSVSFDSRRNIIYYETYKNQLEQYIDDESRQGLRFGFNLMPIKKVTLGGNASWRFQSSGLNKSTNYNGYINVSSIGGLKVRTSVTANFLETSYLSSRILGIRFTHQLWKNKLDAEAYAKQISYQFAHTGAKVNQIIGGASLSLNVARSIHLFLYYEGIFTNDTFQRLDRLNTRLMYRF